MERDEFNFRPCVSLRGAAADQSDHEGAFRGSVCVEGEAAGGAGLPGDQVRGGAQPHGGAEPPEPGPEQEAGGGGREPGEHGENLLRCIAFNTFPSTVRFLYR